MLISQLEVVNGCLATMGEVPLNTLEDDHTYKAAALNYLNEVTLMEQEPGWWFNSEYTQLVPDATSGYIYIPQDAISVKPIHKITPPFAQRGNRLYNTWANSYVWDGNVWVDIVRALTFDNLPYHAADKVRWGTIMRFQREYDGDTVRYQQLSQDYSRSTTSLVAEDTRNKRPNLLLNPSNQSKMARISPMTRYQPYLPIR